MKRLLCGLFIAAMLFSLPSCGTEDGSASKMDSDNGVSVTKSMAGIKYSYNRLYI